MKIKRSKWLKWKVGAVSLLGLIILFHEVKASPAFELAYTNAARQNNTQPTASSQKKQDPVMNEWQQSQASRSMEPSSPSSRRHRQSGTTTDRSGSSMPDTNGSMNSSPTEQSTTAPNTRTGRS